VELLAIVIANILTSFTSCFCAHKQKRKQPV